jgi:hypothetical protein
MCGAPGAPAVVGSTLRVQAPPANKKRAVEAPSNDPNARAPAPWKIGGKLTRLGGLSDILPAWEARNKNRPYLIGCSLTPNSAGTGDCNIECGSSSLHTLTLTPSTGARRGCRGTLCFGGCSRAGFPLSQRSVVSLNLGEQFDAKPTTYRIRSSPHGMASPSSI